MANAAVKKKRPTPTPVKKKVSESKLRELADKAMAEFTAEAKQRYDKAKRNYNKQDDETQDAIDRITTLLCRVTRKNMWVSAGGRGDRVVMSIPEETIYNNMFYMANEILKDLALLDVRVANYTFPANLCVECGIELKSTKPKKKVK